MRGKSSLLIVTTLALLVLSTSLVAAQAIPQGRVQYLYVNAVTGDDKESCERPDHACRSIQAAFDRIPPVLTQEVVVSVAEGKYVGETVLMDRLAPGGHPIRVQGQWGLTLLDGLGKLDTGIKIYRAPRVYLEGLSVTGFRRAGISFDHTAPIEVSRARIFSNGGVGMQFQDTEAVVRESIVDENRGDGIVCDVGGLYFHADEGGNGVVITRNGGNGVRAVGCHAIFAGPSTIMLNHSGLVAEHGAEINLMNRTDVTVSGNTVPSGGAFPPPGDPTIKPVPLSHLPLCELIANNHGVMSGYGGTPLVSTCVCLESHFGVCDPD